MRQRFAGYYINQDTEYDSQGRAYRSSESYFDGDAVVWNSNTHDDIGCVTAFTAADPVKSTTASYDGFTVTVTDAQSRTTTKQTNALGQVIQADDDAGTTMIMTYDQVGNRTQVTNADGTALQNSVTYIYDRLSRMLTQNDPDHGIYTYDALGFQERVQAPGGSTVYYQLLDTDAAGRISTQWLGDGSTVTKPYEAHSSRVISQQSINGATNIQNFSYSYFPEKVLRLRH